MNGLLIAAPSDVPLPPSTDALNAAALERWGPAAEVREAPTPTLATNIRIRVPGKPFFQIDYAADHSYVSCDGNPGQTVKVAVWVRSLLPTDAPRVIAFDKAYSCHVELVPGITADQFRASVVDHSVPGWNEGDPDLARPDQAGPPALYSCLVATGPTEARVVGGRTTSSSSRAFH